MSYPERVLWRIADCECERISRKTILALQRLTEPDCLLSGPETNLKNAWDEICVQMQGEKSFFWDAYLGTTTPHIAFAVEKLSRNHQEAIWLQTPRGEEWESALEETPRSAPICLDDITEYILNKYVLSTASDYHNRRIDEYLERNFLSG